jgi:small-conductance mechanosensitive channel
MKRILLCLIALLLAMAGPVAAASPPAPSAPGPPVSAEQARLALDVLNDPKKRAAMTATLEAIIKAQPAAESAATSKAGAEPAKPAKPAAETTVQGVTIPLMPDSLGAQVLLTASAFLTTASTQAVDAMRTMQSFPLLWGWTVVMATNPMARDLLIDAAWRLAFAMACALVVEFLLRRAVRRPIVRLEALAPGKSQAEKVTVAEPAATALTAEDMTLDESSATDENNAPVGRAREDGGVTEPFDGVARAEAGELEPPVPVRRRPSAWTLLRRIPLVLARLGLELVPVVGIVLAGHLAAASSLGGAQPQSPSRLVILAVIDAYALWIALLSIARMLLSPRIGRLRLLHLSDAAAAYLMRWTRRLVPLAVFGYAIGEVGLLFGMSAVAHDALQKTVGFVLHACLAIMVLQKRRAVRRRLRAPPGATGLIATARNSLARIWHWIALFILAAGWLAWAIELPHGYVQVLHWLIVTGLVLIGARLLLVVLLGSVDRALRVGPQTASLYPEMEARLRLYHAPVMASLRILVFVVAALALLQIYGLGAFVWLVDSALGRRVLSAIGTLTVTVVLALVVWEAINLAIQRHLTKLQLQAQIARSARLRTLLPLVRSTLLITILVVAGLMVLSEIGINIAPLLAGAGIVGVAIGFGSQKLVQDLITGIFLLLENAMQVGDWVTVSGLSGSVEALSVRTIRLRASDGSVHIIPFSAVTSVTNVNRGFGNASVGVTVTYAEDTDRVADLLAEIVAGMRADPTFSARMLSDLQLWGVDKVDGASATIVGQVVCTDSGRWPVQREFNRRMKRRFQEVGIHIYNPLKTIEVAGLPLPPRIAEETEHVQARAAD